MIGGCLGRKGGGGGGPKRWTIYNGNYTFKDPFDHDDDEPLKAGFCHPTKPSAFQLRDASDCDRRILKVEASKRTCYVIHAKYPGQYNFNNQTCNKNETNGRERMSESSRLIKLQKQ